MPLITWKDSFSVGVESIDRQHRKLVDMLNRLHEAMGQGSGHVVLTGIFTELLQYAATHFAMEERLMRQYGYPAFAQHKAAHDNLTEKAKSLKSELDRGVAALSVQTIVFLQNWLTKHILVTDKQYSDCFLQHAMH